MYLLGSMCCWEHGGIFIFLAFKAGLVFGNLKTALSLVMAQSMGAIPFELASRLLILFGICLDWK